MTILPKDRNKILKRINNNKSSSEFQNKLVLLFIENLIPFQNIERNQFQWLISQQFDVPKYINSNAEIMKKKSHRLYLDYQTYLVSYVRSQDELKVSLQIHKWKSHNEINPFLFFSMSFINSEFKLCDYPLGIVDFEDTSIANIFGRGNGGNNLLNSVLGKVSFVTTNFAVSSTISEILQSDGINESNVLQCLPSYINDIVLHFLEQIRKEFSTGDTSLTMIGYIGYESRDMIQIGIHYLLSSIYEKLDIKTSNNELVSAFETLVTFKNDWRKHSKKTKIPLLSSNEISLIEFIVEFIKRFIEIVSLSLKTDFPNSHMVLKWVKILIVHTTAFVKNISNGYFSNSIDKKVKVFLRELLDKLTKYHDGIEKKFEMLLASYLHPSTKRYLTEGDISRINSYVENISNESEENHKMEGNSDPLPFENLDDMIMKVFNCSGYGNKECYNYEILSSSEMKYKKSSKYISLESGPYLLEFWRVNEKKYPTLSFLSKKILSKQLNTDRKFEVLKDQFNTLRKSNYNLQEIQELQFLNHMSKSYDLSKMDPKNLSLDIEKYRFSVKEEFEEEIMEVMLEKGENNENNEGVEVDEDEDEPMGRERSLFVRDDEEDEEEEEEEVEVGVGDGGEEEGEEDMNGNENLELSEIDVHVLQEKGKANNGPVSQRRNDEGNYALRELDQLESQIEMELE